MEGYGVNDGRWLVDGDDDVPTVPPLTFGGDGADGWVLCVGGRKGGKGMAASGGWDRLRATPGRATVGPSREGEGKG